MSKPELRREWLGVLAKAPADRLQVLWQGLNLAPEHSTLRAAETGSVMVRGRAGATGAAFNLGEVTVTRCALQLASGSIGHGYVQGCDKGKAHIAALIDALMQTDRAHEVRTAVLHPLRDAMAAQKREQAAKAAATKVEFFTVARGED